MYRVKIIFQNIIKCILLWFIVLYVIGVRGQLEMVTEGKMHVVNQGSVAVLPCEFIEEKYNLFQQPVLWRKRQLKEEIQMNVAGSLNEPFASLSRFEVSYQSTPPRYKFQLIIRDLCAFDDGNYSCEVRGEFSHILGRVTHQLYIRAPVSSVHISSIDSEKMFQAKTEYSTDAVDGVHSHQESKFLRLVVDRPHSIKCTVFGGYPPPIIDIFIGNRSIFREFNLYMRSSIISGKRGLRVMSHQIEAISQNLRVHQRDHLQPLICLATGPGPKPLYDEVTLKVEYSPLINCNHVLAKLNEPKSLICVIASKPRPDFYAWIVDSKGTFISQPPVVRVNNSMSKNHLDLPLFFSLQKPLSPDNLEFSMSVTSLQEDREEMRLYISHVTSSSPRKFPVVVRNSIATTTSYIHLSIDERRHDKSKVSKQQVKVTDRFSSGQSFIHTWIYRAFLSYLISGIGSYIC